MLCHWVVQMSISELTKQVREAAKKRTPAQTVELLRQANIIDDEGYCSEEFFSSKAVAKDKKSGKALQI